MQKTKRNRMKFFFLSSKKNGFNHTLTYFVNNDMIGF